MEGVVVVCPSMSARVAVNASACLLKHDPFLFNHVYPRNGPCLSVTRDHSPNPTLPCSHPPCTSSSQQQQAKAVPWTQQQALPTYTMYGAMGGGGGGALTKEEGGGVRVGGVWKADDAWDGSSHPIIE